MQTLRMQSSNGTSTKIGIKPTREIEGTRENRLGNGHCNANQGVDQIVIVHGIVRVGIVETAPSTTFHLLNVHIGLHVQILGVHDDASKMRRVVKLGHLDTHIVTNHKVTVANGRDTSLRIKVKFGCSNQFCAYLSVHRALDNTASNVLHVWASNDKVHGNHHIVIGKRQHILLVNARHEECTRKKARHIGNIGTSQQVVVHLIRAQSVLIESDIGIATTLVA